MAIDYFRQSEKYRPRTIDTLLVGEAPPASGKTYFYVPRAMSNAVPIEQDRSLPTTIFNHYFQRRPTTVNEYEGFLLRLRERGIFLIDICDEPIKVRRCPEGVERIKTEIPKLRRKMELRGIRVPDEDIVFLLARKDYEKEIRKEFPCSQRIPWKHFRMCPEPVTDG